MTGVVCSTPSIAGILNRLEQLNEFALAVQMCGQYKYTCGISPVFSSRCTATMCAKNSQRQASLDDRSSESCAFPSAAFSESSSAQSEVQKRRLRLHRHHLRSTAERQNPAATSPSSSVPTSPQSANFLSHSAANTTDHNNSHTSSSSQQTLQARRSCVSNHNHSNNSNNINSTNNSNNNNSNNNYNSNKYVHNSLSSLLLSWIILVVFSTTSLTNTMAAPIGSSTTPKWVNPCGVNPDQVLGSHEVEIPPLKPSELYNNIALQAQLAKEQADEVSPQYVMDAFKDPQFPNYSKELSYKWLPIIPEPMSDHIEGMQAEEALRSSYEYLQFYAVGLEQIVLDQIVYEGTFLDEFRQMEGKLRQVLCEIQLAMLEMKFKQNADVTRAVMAQEFRDMDSKTARDLRDWIILRDYIGALNYISTVFANFKARADTAEGSS